MDVKQLLSYNTVEKWSVYNLFCFCSSVKTVLYFLTLVLLETNPIRDSAVVTFSLKLDIICENLCEICDFL